MISDTSKPRVLLLTLSNWIGAPRLPRAFERAGFHVVTFGYPGLLLMRSQAAHEVVYVSAGQSNEELLRALMELVERLQPAFVVPTDDATILLLHAARARAARAGSSDALAVYERSLGDAKHAATVRSRKLLARLAEVAGVRAPSFAAVHGEGDALAFAARYGYPVVLKEEDSVAGMGVTVSKDETELCAAVARYATNPATLVEGVLAQTFLAGRTAMRCVVAHAGRVLTGISALKLETWPGPRGPSTCVEVIEHAELSAAAEAVIAALGYSGFASLDFMLDADGRAYLIELNPRPTPIAHLGERFGDCLCRKLGSVLGVDSRGPERAASPPSRVALFPQEWVRDPSSPHIAAGVFHDVPWDEPDLVDAYVAMGRSQMRFDGYRALAARRAGLHALLAEHESAASFQTARLA